MEAILAKNQFVWSFMASLRPMWKTFWVHVLLGLRLAQMIIIVQKNNILSRG